MDKDSSQASKIVLKGMLLSELQEVENIAQKTLEDRAPVKLDQQAVGRLSRMDAMQQQSIEKAKQVRRVERIKLINAALKRLEAGDFGFCLNCDAQISDGRLRLDPTFALCIDCAR
jgi:DnaK suppressor protein|tara:strand:+ start:1524 stop:1871 length:348 start_codon:yes stop_codon:yes gene_type:complete